MNLEKLIPTGKFKVTILAGANGSGKSKLLKDFAEKFGYDMYIEKYTDGVYRQNDMLYECLRTSHIIIDNIELYLHCDNQTELLNEIFKLNPEISIVCSTHSPMIIMNGWMDRVINIEDL